MERKKRIVIILLVFAVIIIWTGRVMKVNMPESELDLTKLKSEDIEKIHGYFYSDSYNGENDSSVELTRGQIEKFIEIMNQVKLTKKVSEKKAQSNGASITYTVTMKDGTQYVLRPGQDFKVNDTYYKFQNYDMLWDKITTFMSTW